MFTQAAIKANMAMKQPKKQPSDGIPQQLQSPGLVKKEPQKDEFDWLQYPDIPILEQVTSLPE